MRLSLGLRARLVVLSLICGLLGAAGSEVVSRVQSYRGFARIAGPVLQVVFAGEERRRCEASPETWTLSTTRSEAFAYDAATLTSRNPLAPPLDRGVFARIAPGDDPPASAQTLRWNQSGGVLVVRTAESGPCSVVQTTWRPAFSTWELVGLRGGGGLATGALAALLGTALAIVPLARRIKRLRQAAAVVGEPDGYASAERPGGDDLGQLSMSLDRAHARIRADALRLEQRSADLERHLSDVAHDFRTPLASLQLALERASEAIAAEERDELLRTALGDVVYLGALSANLKLASQMREGWDPGTGEDAQTDLAEIALRVVARSRVFAKRRQIALEVAVPDDPVIVRCHPVAAERALGNIVENALTHGESGGHVVVVLDTTRESFTLRIEDDGPGVLPSELPRLKERTFRTDAARRRDPRGSGLGLAISAQVCERCGFSIDFEAGEPRGLSVVIRGSRAPRA